MICNDRKKWPGAAVPEEPGSSSYLCLHGLRMLAPVEFAGVAGVRQFRQEDIVAHAETIRLPPLPSSPLEGGDCGNEYEMRGEGAPPRAGGESAFARDADRNCS